MSTVVNYGWLKSTMVIKELIKVSRRRLVAEFEMKDLDMMHYFLSMEVCGRMRMESPWDKVSMQ